MTKTDTKGDSSKLMNMFKFNLTKWGDDLDNEFKGSSDRAAAVVGAAMLDAQLKILFEARLNYEALNSNLFSGTNAPLHSLSNKANLALALGMISQLEYKNLTLIRKIRNEFAHMIGDVSFETSNISNRCRELDVPIGMRLPDLIPEDLIENVNADPSSLPPIKFETPRERFQVAVIYLSSCFNGRLLEIIDAKVEPRPEYKRTSEIIDLLLNRSDAMNVQLSHIQTRIDILRKQLKQKEELFEIEKPFLKDQTAIIENKKNIEETQAFLNNIKQGEEQQLLNLLNPLTKFVFTFVKRWEAWVENK